MRDGRKEGTGTPQWVPLLVGLAIAGASVALWQVLRVEERAQVDRIVRSETNRVKSEIDARMETRIIALERMAMEWETRGGLREEEWESYVKLYFRQYPATIAISWVDPSFRPREVFPRHMEKSVRSIPLRERMRVGSAPDPSREKIGPKISSRLNLGENGKAILASVPVLRDGRIEGYLLAVLRIDVLLGKILENVALDYAIAIDDGSGVIYTRDRPAGEGEDPPGWGATLERHEMNWRIRVSPTDKLKKEMGSSIDEITLAGGIAIAALFTLATGLARKAGRRAREAEAANRELEVVIAQRLRVEEELRKSGAYSRSLLEAALDPLVTIGQDGKITDVNHATESVTGFPREALVGADFTEYFTEPEKAREGYKQVFAEGFVTDYPLTIRHREGRLVDVLYNASVYRDMQGNVLGVFAAARDITERKRANEDLRKAVAYNRSLIESSLDPLVTISSDGAITDANAATENVTGLPREVLVGTDFSDYFTDPEKAREGYRKVFREGSVQDYALEIRHRSGKVTPVLYNASVYRDDAGAVVGIFAAARDITERKRAEEDLRKAGAYNRSLIESSLDPLVTISSDGAITDVNAATEKVTGLPGETLVGTDFSDYFTDPEKAREGYRKVFREGSVQDYRAGDPAPERKGDAGAVQRFRVSGRHGGGRRCIRGRPGRHGADEGGKSAFGQERGTGPVQRGAGKVRLRGLP